MTKPSKIIIAGTSKVGLNGEQFRTSIPKEVITRLGINTINSYFQWQIVGRKIILKPFEK